jgi:sulfhydrogenase subunit alpha
VFIEKMSKTITLNHITKIEGHASLNLGIRNGKVKRCELSATEGSRYFEGIVRNRRYYEAHEMTSRICGICSCAHVVAALSAIENATGIKASFQTKMLRELMTLGERRRSHTTHLYFLSLPDYLGYESALAMAKKYRKELQNALSMMKAGNGVIKTLGARDLHPVSAAVGGWLKLPSNAEMAKIRDDLESIKEDAVKTCELFSSFRYPDFQTEGNFFSLKDKSKFAILDGVFSSGKKLFAKSQYRKYIREYPVVHSNANFVTIDGEYYSVGALPRINNNHVQLSSDAKKKLNNYKFKFPSKNPYHNNFCQAVELVHCIDEAISLCEKISIQKEPLRKPKKRTGTGVGAIEVPRGTLWHEYSLKNGLITSANIITPTAQNLLNIQEDIRSFVPSVLNKRKKEIVMDVEKLIRSYDPCFSCSAHFLEVKWL